MAGIYIHIPYCKKACHYCDFHFSTSLNSIPDLVKSIVKEVHLRKDFFSRGEIIETIYFGGGTPSVLSYSFLNNILSVIRSEFNISSNAEITLEANPEDLNVEYLRKLRQLGFNRLSIGIQSFDDHDLKLMNRLHDADAAFRAITNAGQAGFDNITIDLMYGMPGSDLESWKVNVERAIETGVNHISAYCLTVEPKTALHKMVSSGLINIADDETSSSQFLYLSSRLTEAGFIHYEISNFGKPEFFSRHNSAYWQNIPYLGIGPSAHSYNLTHRFWNLSNNQGYIKAIREFSPFFDQEKLTLKDSLNDRIMTSLRTIWGLSVSEIRSSLSPKDINFFELSLNKYKQSGDMEQKGDIVYLTTKGRLVADRIISDLLIL